MEKVAKYFQMETNIRVNIKMGNLMEEESMNGVKGDIIKDNLLKVCDKEKVNG